jgi:hypothetical protein
MNLLSFGLILTSSYFITFIGRSNLVLWLSFSSDVTPKQCDTRWLQKLLKNSNKNLNISYNLRIIFILIFLKSTRHNMLKKDLKSIYLFA